ncbi:MAG: helix-turn-helix transcriptional regulator [Methanobrevibacter sp.]|uniref:helix-turn-helix domain-containing protein n=1 Tax=Methanobrevibacter sp. TaxID=66852 RepID=UPI0025D960A9|nr:helix-turn-helix transcriptional regulator [Methanobrevibacter sp.]MBR0271081.1 helix-turn-helix transcriptional regulator [Methanobrevibacter sp.]
MKNVGARMETLRENMNLTPQALSSYLDIPTEDLLDMENGNKNITLSILNKLCSLFGCSESYLLCRSEEFDYTKFAFRSSSIEVADLEGIASMNRIYMNMKYLTSKMDD